MIFTYRNEPVEIAEGTTYLSLAEKFRGDYAAPIILARVANRPVELGDRVNSEELRKGKAPELSFITVSEREGHKTYERGAEMMFLRAMTHVFGRRIVKLKLEYGLGDGYYFSVAVRNDDGTASDDAVTESALADVKSTMLRYSADNEKFQKLSMPTAEAIELFRRHGMNDKVRLLHYRRTSYTNVYRLGNYFDYYYGCMPPSTGFIRSFDLRKIEGGILLILPKRNTPGEPGSPEVSALMFESRRRSTVWGENLGVPTVAALNDAIARGEGTDIILASEAYHEHNLGLIAARIKEEGRKIVMIAGPSSSGKTSFSHRLSVQLANVGLKAHPIACDNYYVTRTETPLDENGEYDFECLEAIDTEAFNAQMSALLRGEEVELRSFNFKTGIPEFNGNYLRMGADDVLVIEGIHCLNDRLSYMIDPDRKFKIYISALTALNIDEHNRLSTTDLREIRRLVRDARTRGFSASETIARWESVRHGEEENIFPFRETADVTFNSATLYDLSVLKTFAEPLLFAIDREAPEYTEASRLLKLLDYFLGLSCEDVPRNSLLREFIGGSLFPVG
jgi:uridine kinase